MAQFREGGKKTNKWVWIVSGIALVLGIVLIVVVNWRNVVSWMKVCGTALGVLLSVPLVLVGCVWINKKIKEM